MKYLFTLFTFFAITPVFAQEYQLQTGNQPWENLSEGVSMPFPIGWDDEELPLGIGFEFPAGGSQYDTLLVNTNGYITTSDGNFEFNPYYVDLIGIGDETSINYAVEGDSGSRILKIEYFNAGFYEDTTGTARVSFQAWFFENGCWEVRTGPATLVDTFMIFENYPGPFIGYANYADTTVLALNGASSAPFVLAIDSIDFPSLNDVPLSGMVYTFCPPTLTTSLAPMLNEPVLLYPNPAKQAFRIAWGERKDIPKSLEIFDLRGQRVTQKAILNSNDLISLDGIVPGAYLIQFSDQTIPPMRLMVE